MVEYDETMNILIFSLYVLILGMIPIAYAETTISNEELEKRIIELEQNIISLRLIATFGLIIVSAVGVIVSSYFVKRAHITSKQVSEVDLILRLSEKIFESETGKWIIEKSKDPNSRIIEIDVPMGYLSFLVPHREMENFLNKIETVLLLKEQNLITDVMTEHEFTWVIDRIVQNNSITEFRNWKRKEFESQAWDSIHKYKPKRIINSHSRPQTGGAPIR